ncbi:MAG TPA: NeuD/PglB/VioB family sugar acetyltransferase [Bradyrhizobium sp.]|jgi:acetyltransferase EpsM|nr:NeuD/PglB/VioB family sugar acetyltransferase [Bradyrhizobium sp.]
MQRTHLRHVATFQKMSPSGYCRAQITAFHGSLAVMEPRSLLFLGDGSFAVEALDIAEAAGGFTPLGFVNSMQRPVSGSTLAGLPIFWIDDIPFAADRCDVVCAIVTTRRRSFIEAMRSRGYRFRSLIHPFASVSRRARIRDGCILNAGVVVGSNVDVGEYTIVNRGALIGHDNRTGKCCTIGPGANIAGNVEIGDGTFIGQGAVIRERLKIGKDAAIAAGAVVLQDVQPNDMVAGIPARIIKSGVNGY